MLHSLQESCVPSACIVHFETGLLIFFPVMQVSVRSTTRVLPCTVSSWLTTDVFLDICSDPWLQGGQD